MRKIPTPWGHELVWAETAQSVGKGLGITAGERLSLQFHHVMDLEVEDDGRMVTRRMQPAETSHI